MTEERELQLNALMETIPYSHRYLWCRAYACACMGCVNHILLPKGFTEEDHSQWVSKHPKEYIHGGFPHTYTTWTCSQSMN